LSLLNKGRRLNYLIQLRSRSDSYAALIVVWFSERRKCFLLDKREYSRVFTVGNKAAPKNRIFGMNF
jgi:hypothetical protein